MINRLLAAGALCAAAIAPTHGSPAAPVQDAEYLRTHTTTVVRNFPDGNGSALATVPAGTLLRGYLLSEGKPSYRQVEVAGGFPVWVFGQYLQPTDVDGVLLVTGSRVNMRPKPKLTKSSMALKSKLDAGQRVKFIERAHRAEAFGEDWIKIQAPPSTRGWIVADAVVAAEVADGAAMWAQVNPPLPTRSSRSTRGASAGPGAQSTRNTGAAAAPTISAGLLAELAAADRAFDAANALRSPTTEAWRDVVMAYESVVEKAPAGSVTRQNAASRLDRARLNMSFVALREDYNNRARKHEAEVDEINDYIRSREERKSARWGRFQSRGWVDARSIAGETRWFLTFGGSTVAEIRCASARYDLSVFEGFEIGVVGDEIAAGVHSTSTSAAQARVVDVSKIEVISGSSIRR